MRFYIDCEFVTYDETANPNKVTSIADLISIGIAMDGKDTLYAINAEYYHQSPKRSNVCQWAMDNTIPIVDQGPSYNVKTLPDICSEVKNFIDIKKGGSAEFYGWNCWTDWQMFIWLTFGDIGYFPSTWNRYMTDVKQTFRMLEGSGCIPLRPPEGSFGQVHHPLDDAMFCRTMFHIVRSHLAQPRPLTI